MTPERWAAAQELFEAALALPDDRRAAWVDDHAADADLAALVGGMLEADAVERGGEPLEAVVRQAMVETAGAPRPAPDRLGPYKIVRMLGEGGMGAVYLAERDDDEFLQQVAIKVARGLLDPERVRQFRTERQILAWLEHPNIARLFDGGTTADGLPYLVMEHVEGQPIDAYCNQRRLDVAARLRLFLDVCDAVSHAHRSLIVHRDIKPSNIMVTDEGVPKLLDFGIARLALEGAPDAAAAGAGPQGMMTPYYASPEVVRGGQVTTAADVYALGVLLHELLTGTRPLRFRTMTSEEVERVVCHVDPRPPSLAARDTDDQGPPPADRAAERQTTPEALAAQLAGDLDAIVARALHKAPAQRYASVEALAADIRAALEHRPVSARPQTWRYVVGRFVGRHRWATAAAVTAAVAVSAAAVLFSAQAARLAEERDRTARERDTARQVSRFLTDLFDVSNPDVTGSSAPVTAQELLKRGAERIDADLAGQPVVQARLLATMGMAYTSQGAYQASLALFQRALELRRATLGPDDLDTVASMDDMGEAYRELGRFDEAESMHREALAAKERLGAPPASIAASLNNVGLTLSERGRFTEAEPLLRQALDMWRRHEGPTADVVASGLNNLADVVRQQGRVAEAVPLLEEAIAIRRQTVGATHPSLAIVVGHLGRVFSQQGDAARAEPLLREALNIRQHVYGVDHPDTVNTRSDLTSLLHDQGDLAGAEPFYRAAVSSLATRLGPTSPDYAVQVNNLATVLEDQRRFEEAERLYRESLAIRQRSDAPVPQSVARAQHNLARTLLAMGRIPESEELVRSALATRQAVFPPGHFETALSQVLLGKVLAARRRPADAAPLLAAAVESLRADSALDPRYVAYGLLALSEFHRVQGHAERAEPLAREATTRLAKLPAGHWLRATAKVELAAGLAALKRPDEAAGILRPALRELTRRFGEADDRVRDAVNLLAALGV
ncbi:MAG: serine/threonine protein kinase [Acidobacteria bacterium]|nr:serine/threonine protein kinase [Acidobacteriota bacterium]